MRLIDRFAAAPRVIDVRDPAGTVHRLPGTGYRNDTLASCPLRYILDESASNACHSLAMQGDYLLQLCPDALRLPAPTFWIEWIANPPISEEPGTRIGALVETDESGREGFVTPFFDGPDGQIRMVPGRIEFDLDNELTAEPGSIDSFRIMHASLGSAEQLLRHAIFQHQQAWASFHRASSQSVVAKARVEMAETSWLLLPLTLAFAALLNSGGALRERASDFSRLNAKRSRSGKSELLEHIEVRMSLGQSLYQASDRKAAGSRSQPRHHPVRGHLVHRAGRIFWRKAHVRGDLSRAILSRTVNVAGQR
jgi:hypothetical protein